MNTQKKQSITREIYEGFQRVEFDRWDVIIVTANTLDLAIYEWERNWPIPHNIRPEPIIVGIDRRNEVNQTKHNKFNLEK